MEEDKNIRSNKFTDRIKAISRNRKILIFLVFLFISSILWFLNTLNKEYITQIDIPLRYVNIPDQKKLVDDYNKTLSVEISGHGYNILQLKLESFSIPVIVNLKRNPPRKTTYNPNRYFVLTRDLESEISKRTGSNLRIISIKPDSLFLNYTAGYHKTVPIINRASYLIGGDFILRDDPILKPDSVTISGNKDIIEGIEFVETENRQLGNINRSQEFELKLIKTEDINYSSNVTKINFVLEKAIETKLNISINPLNFPPSARVIFIPRQVEITCKVPADLFNSVAISDFKVYADYEKRSGNTVEIKAESLNKSFKIQNIRPDIVHFLIEQQ